MKFRFKANAGTIAVLLAAVLSVVALIFSIISNSKGADAGAYAVTGFGAVVAFCVVAIVLALAAFVLDGLFQGKLFSIIVDVMKIVAAGLLIACICIMIDTRGDLMGYIWFSDLETGNANAVSALYMALVSWIAYFLAIVSMAVSAYSDTCVKTKKPAEAEA